MPDTPRVNRARCVGSMIRERGIQRTMATTVIIPAQLRQYTQDQSSLKFDGATVDEVLRNLDDSYPGLRSRICEPDGRLRRFVNIFVNGEDVRSLDGVNTPVKSGDEIGIVPAVAGGQERLTARLPRTRRRIPVVIGMS